MKLLLNLFVVVVSLICAQLPGGTAQQWIIEFSQQVERVCDSPQALAELNANPPCPAPRHCMFTNPDNCQTFIQCQPGGPAENGVTIQYTMPCGYGLNGQLYWNDNMLTCEEQNNSTCPTTTPFINKYGKLNVAYNTKFDSVLYNYRPYPPTSPLRPYTPNTPSLPFYQLYNVLYYRK